MKSAELLSFADRHNINFDANLARLSAESQQSFIGEWAADYAINAPIFHTTTPQSAKRIVRSGQPLMSHRQLHPDRSSIGAVENTIGRTAEFDVQHGLDEFVFASIGKLAVMDDAAFVAFTIKKDALGGSVASFKDVAAMDAIVLCPAEQFNEDDADQAKVNSENAEILAKFITDLVPAERFNEPFSGYLGSNYNSVKEFLEEFSFKKGFIDLPRRGSAAYDELVAMINMFEQAAPRMVFNYFKHGHYYSGPQLMIPSEVPPDQLDGLIAYQGYGANYVDIRSMLHSAEKKGLNVDLVTPEDVTDYIADNIVLDPTNATVSEIFIATRSALNVLFNQRV